LKKINPDQAAAALRASACSLLTCTLCHGRAGRWPGSQFTPEWT